MCLIKEVVCYSLRHANPADTAAADIIRNRMAAAWDGSPVFGACGLPAGAGATGTSGFVTVTVCDLHAGS